MNIRHFQHRFGSLSAISALCLVVFLTACSDDDVEANDGGQSNDGEQCPAGQEWNPVAEQCEPDGNGPTDDTGIADDTDVSSDAGGDNGVDPCDGWQCETPDCPDGQTTSITGTVHIPSGELPLPDVAVYVPGSEVEDISEGASCEPCKDELSAVIATGDETDINGHFTIDDAPAGEQVPLVIEVGKWRRQQVVEVEACQDNPLPDEQTRLPRNRDEGDIPQMAVTTGEYDALECLVKRIGVDRHEFTPEPDHPDFDPDEDEVGAVNLFAARGGTDRYESSLNDGVSFTTAWDWWDDYDNLVDYDIILHSCEGTQHLSDKSQQARDSLYDFTTAGGRVFLSHWQNAWLEHGPAPFEQVAEWAGGMGDTPLADPETASIDTSFPKGQMLQNWMYNNGTTPAGEFPVYEARGTIESIDHQYAQRWVWLDEPEGFDMPGFPDFGFDDPPDELEQYFSFNTPLNVQPDQQCGRVVFSDIHVAAGNTSSPDNPFPQGCVSGDLTAQEKALVFMLFDLSRCITPDKKQPSQ